MVRCELATMRQGRWVYKSAETWWAAVGGAVIGIVLLALSAGGHRGWVALLVGGVVSLLVGLRMVFVGIRPRAKDVVVATFVGSRSVEWNEVDHFAVMPLGRYPYVGTVVCRNGRNLQTFGLSTSAWQKGESSRDRIQRPIDELNRVLDDHRSSAAVPR